LIVVGNDVQQVEAALDRFVTSIELTN
jgi:hypothetical protein